MNDLFPAFIFVVSMSFVAGFKQLPRWVAARKSQRLMSTGHMASTSAPKLSPTEEQAMTVFKERQADLKRLSYAEEVRTLLDQSIGFGVLSTNSVQHAGFPTGSVVGFQLDERGLPFFSFSTMSAHTHDLLENGKASLTVLAKDFKGAAEGRVNIAGTIKKVEDEETKAELRAQYRLRHKDAYWVDFGDFSFFRMESIETIRFVGGFAMAGNVAAADYHAARPDPLAPFAHFIVNHMNEDHAHATAAIVRHYAGVGCTEATIVSVDRYGITTKARIDVPGMTAGYHKVRVCFPRETTERKAVKDVIIEMTNIANGKEE